MRIRILFTLIAFAMVVCFGSIVSTGIDEGLIVYYPFDEATGDTASDASKNGNDAKLTGNAKWEPNDGKIDGALRLDGSDSSTVDDDGGDYINGLEAFTIAVWVKSDTAGHDRGIIHSVDPDGGDNVFTLRYDAASWSTPGGTNLIKGAVTTTGGGQVYEGKSNVQTTEWQHLAFLWSSGEKLKLYIDGELDDNPTHNDDGKTGSITGAAKFIVGKGAKDASASWPGLIDDVRIYDRVLSESEIAELASGVLAVEADSKLATTWADLKQKRD